MKEALRLVAIILGGGLGIWIYRKWSPSWEEWSDRVFGPSLRRGPTYEPPKVEIQSLFDGNTKDQDQL